MFGDETVSLSLSLPPPLFLSLSSFLRPLCEYLSVIGKARCGCVLVHITCAPQVLHFKYLQRTRGLKVVHGHRDRGTPCVTCQVK